MKKMKMISAAIFMAIASTSVMAQESVLSQDSVMWKDWGLSVKGGTAGVGFDVTKKITEISEKHGPFRSVMDS